MDADTPTLPEISDKTYFKIGEVAEILGVKPYILRYWESEFRYVSPQKTRSRPRMYRKKDIEILLQIKALLYDQMYTIAGAQKRLKEMIRDGQLEIFAEEGEAGVMGDEALEGTETAALEQEVQQLTTKLEQVTRERDEAEEAAKLATLALKEVQAAHDEAIAEVERLESGGDNTSAARLSELETTIARAKRDLERVTAERDELRRRKSQGAPSSGDAATNRRARSVLEALRGEIQGMVELIEPYGLSSDG